MTIDWPWVRTQIIGADAEIDTPYGRRRLLYADYTASGRAVRFIEDYMRSVLELYANTHTEDDTTGETTTARMHQAETLIKRHLNAGDEYALICVGSGATGAINRLQEILGVYIPPATRARLGIDSLGDRAPVVFVGPYEHHSNEISWRESLAETVEIALDADGFLDLEDLEAKLSDPVYAGRQKIGSFSAASNVSGVRTDVYRVAELLHRHGALAFFDFSAAAPYGAIDVNRGDGRYFDAVFFSPHKYLGGPGAAGVLVFRREVYRGDLPPSESGGGTVTFVSASGQDYVNDIEAREKSGTPGILQTMRAALALDLQRRLGIEEIERRELEVTRWVLSHLADTPNVTIMGNAPPERRLSIISFTVSFGDGQLHPRFVVRLLNDLFGIQARAGCSCAGPYGHTLLNIDVEQSKDYRELFRRGREGVKPGWARMNVHYLFSDEEVERLLQAIDFVAARGYLFLQDYRFNVGCGGWRHVNEVRADEAFGIASALASGDGTYSAATGTPRARDTETAAARGSGAARPVGATVRPAASWAEAFSAAQRRAEELERSFHQEHLLRTEEGTIRYWYRHGEGRHGCAG